MHLEIIEFAWAQDFFNSEKAENMMESDRERWRKIDVLGKQEKCNEKKMCIEML